MNEMEAKSILLQGRETRWETQPRWAIVEVFGHRKFGARVTDVERYGVRFLSCEVQGYRTPVVIELSPAAIFQLTPVSEGAAKSETPTHDVVPPTAIPCIVDGCLNHPRTSWQKECEVHTAARLEREHMEREVARLERKRLDRIATGEVAEPTLDLSAGPESPAICGYNGCKSVVEVPNTFCRPCLDSIPF